MIDMSKVSMFDPNFGRLQNIAQQQQEAQNLNQQNHDAWPGRVTQWQEENGQRIALGLSQVTPPDLPQMKMVADDGTVTFQPFPDLRPATMPVPTAPPSGGIRATVNVPPDRTDQIQYTLSQFLMIFQKFDTDLTAIKTALKIS